MEYDPMAGGDVAGVVLTHVFVTTLYSQVSASLWTSETPPKRTIVPFEESNAMAEYARADGAFAGFWFVHVFAEGLYTQVSQRFRALYPPKRTTKLCVVSYAIAGPSRAPGFEAGASFFQSVASCISWTVAGAPVPTTRTLLRVPALKSASVSQVLVAASALGRDRMNPIVTIATAISTAIARTLFDRNIGSTSSLESPLD